MKPIIALAFVAIALSSCKVNFSNNTAGHAPMAASGPETWTVEGKTIDVQKTYLLALPEGLQYTIETTYDFGSSAQLTITQPQAVDIAFPIMKYAYENNLYSRTSISRNGTPLTPTRIGVVLIQNINGRSRGYRVGLSLDEIRARGAKG